MKWKIEILTHLGLKENEVPSEDQLNEGFATLIADHAALKTERDGFATDIESLSKLEDLKPMAAVGETYLADQRKEAEKLYKLLKGENASEEMLKLIQDATIEQAKTYVSEFSKEVEEKIPGICSECGKPATLTRRSSKEIHEEKLNEQRKDDFKLSKIR